MTINSKQLTSVSANTHEKEVGQGVRFRFGRNWSRFLNLLTDERIRQAEESLKTMLNGKHLAGRRFLDCGSGSGLFSLAARRLGASVVSFDYDPQSVECTSELKNRYFPNDPNWWVEAGSILDSSYLGSLGQFDIVYSWGVIHHTGAMWLGLANVAPLVSSGGKLFIAIYNDQGLTSRYWHLVKKTYVKHPIMRCPLLALHMIYPFFPSLIYRIISKRTKFDRGMSFWYDVIDWVGGFPFEVASPEAIFEFYEARGFRLVALKTTNRSGCNQFVFSKETAPTSTKNIK